MKVKCTNCGHKIQAAEPTGNGKKTTTCPICPTVVTVEIKNGVQTITQIGPAKPTPKSCSSCTKSRRVAQNLAMFGLGVVSIFTWTYTFRKDWWKFAIAATTLLLTSKSQWVWIVVWAFTIADTRIKSSRFYDYYPNGGSW